MMDIITGSAPPPARAESYLPQGPLALHSGTGTGAIDRALNAAHHLLSSWVFFWGGQWVLGQVHAYNSANRSAPEQQSDDPGHGAHPHPHPTAVGLFDDEFR